MKNKRIKVQSIIIEYKQGILPSDIARIYSLSLDEVEAAIEYYQNNKTDIDRHIADSQSRIELLKT